MLFLSAVCVVVQEVTKRLAEGDRDHFLPVRAGREALCTVSVVFVCRRVVDVHICVACLCRSCFVVIVVGVSVVVVS